MKNQVIGVCPVCQHNLTVTRLSCEHCQTEINGAFVLSSFQYLSKDELSFVEQFLRAEGNIKEMERVLNVSYPTVKKLLGNVLKKMGYDNSDAVEPVDEQDVLDRLKRKEISVQEAAALLKQK